MQRRRSKGTNDNSSAMDRGYRGGGSYLTDIRRLTFVEPDTELLVRLLPVARRIFTETFGHLFEAKDFDAFCTSAYSPDGSMAQDFNDPNVRWRIATADGQPVGYAKLTPLRAPAVKASENAVELQQIYIESTWHGCGVADTLMMWGLDTARSVGATEIYLTVFDHNERAKRFYTRYGFEDVGSCTFQLGERIYDDRIWRLKLI